MNSFVPCEFHQIAEPKDSNKIVLQFDIEGIRQFDLPTIEIFRFSEVMDELEISLDQSFKKGYQIIGIDFSDTDLNNAELAEIVKILLKKVGTITVLNVEGTHTNARTIKKYTKKIPTLLGYPDKTLHGFILYASS